MTPATSPSTKPPVRRRPSWLWRILRTTMLVAGVALALWLALSWWGHHPNASSLQAGLSTQKPSSRRATYPIYRLRDAERKALLARRRYLLAKVLLKKAGTKAMPRHLPAQFQGEWALVTHSMVGIALANLAYLLPSLRRESQQQLDALLQRVLSPGLRSFDAQRWGHDPLTKLGCSHGHLGYLGHLNLLLAARHSLGQSSTYSPLYHKISAALVRKLQHRPSWIADTYPAEQYTSDHAVVIASLALYDRFFPQRATSFARRWLHKMTRCCQDPTTGLLAFQVNTKGKPTTGSRGSGAAWDLYFLSHVDLPYTRRQYKQLKRHFVSKVFFVTGIREWPHGIQRSGDIDSGPLIFGLSPAGTGFAIGITRLAGDTKLLNQLLSTADLGGISMRHGNKRYYLLAPLVGEASLLAMRTALPWDRRYQPDN